MLRVGFKRSILLFKMAKACLSQKAWVAACAEREGHRSQRPPTQLQQPGGCLSCRLGSPAFALLSQKPHRHSHWPSLAGQATNNTVGDLSVQVDLATHPGTGEHKVTVKGRSVGNNRAEPLGPDCLVWGWAQQSDLRKARTCIWTEKADMGRQGGWGGLLLHTFLQLWAVPGLRSRNGEGAAVSPRVFPQTYCLKSCKAEGPRMQAWRHTAPLACCWLPPLERLRAQLRWFLESPSGCAWTSWLTSSPCSTQQAAVHGFTGPDAPAQSHSQPLTDTAHSGNGSRCSRPSWQEAVVLPLVPAPVGPLSRTQSPPSQTGLGVLRLHRAPCGMNTCSC